MAMIESWLEGLPTSKLQTAGALLGVYLVCKSIAKAYFAYRRWVPEVPVIGRSGMISSWITAFQYYTNCQALVQEGYDKYGDFAFQVASLRGWELYICDEEMVTEYVAAPENHVSFRVPARESMQSKYTAPAADVCKFDTVTPMLRGLGWLRGRSIAKNDPYFPELVEEFLYALEQEIDFNKDGWTSVPAYTTSARIIARITAKALVGRPLCRDPEIVDIFCRYAITVSSSGRIINHFPEFLRPLVAMFCPAPQLLEQMVQKITSDIATKHMNPPKEPQDLADWYVRYLAQNVPAENYSSRDISLQMASNVFASIYTTNTAFVQSLFEIAYRPEYVEPLREEIADALREHGAWSKKAIESMRKLDSFIKECQRVYPMDTAAQGRKVLKDFTFKHGLKIPGGNYVQSVQRPVMLDNRYYPEADRFDGFRFYKLGVETGKPNDHRIVAVNPRFRAFGGQGKHVCPGRFHAADEIRLMLGYFVFNYDIAFKDHSKTRPSNFMYSRLTLPNLKAEIMLKRREGVDVVQF